jgi:hypothetical protein
MSVNATFPSAVNNGRANVSTGDSGVGTPSHSQLLITAATAGTVVKRVHGHARVTTTAGFARLWIVNGGTYYLREELPVAAVTPSTTQAAWNGDFTCATIVQPLQLQTGDTLHVSMENSNSCDFEAEGADLT